MQPLTKLASLPNGCRFAPRHLANPHPRVEANFLLSLIMNSTCLNGPVCPEPDSSVNRFHATFARIAPSGQGLMVLFAIALIATSLPRINLTVSLSNRSELLITFQSLYSGMKPIPFGAGRTSCAGGAPIHFSYSSVAAANCAALDVGLVR